ncbi:hypothetical protein DPV78_003368 [Talaromyces pinophilus]|nr:hypothetical protein DPV78_003368 [Talaromyces pinophilus]
MLLLKTSHQYLHRLADGEIATREAIWVPESDPTMESDEASEAATAESPFPGGSLGIDGNNVNEQQIVIDPKRPVAITACELCKARKVRCDRAEPACGWCSRRGRTCIYKERQKPGFRAGHVRALETKINRIEGVLQSLSRQIEDCMPLRVTNGEALPPVTSAETLRFLNDQENYTSITAPVQIADGIFPVLSRSDEPLQTLRTVELVPAQPDINHRSRSLDHINPDSVKNLELPRGELLYNLVDLYFKHINTWCPILDRRATFDSYFSTSVADEADNVALAAILAISLRFSQDPSLTSEVRRKYYSLAKDKVILYATENTSIKSLQALVILTWDSLGSSDGPQGGLLLAMVVRMALQLNLHVESSIYLSSSIPDDASPGQLRQTVLPQPHSWIEEEGRRRLFWMIYIMERYAAVASGSEVVLPESWIHRYLPCRYDLFSKNQPVETRWFSGTSRANTNPDRPENLGSFSYHCEVTSILSRVRTFLESPVDVCSIAEVEQWNNRYRELDDELNAWLSNLPDDYSKVSQLCHSDPTSKIANWITLHAVFVTCVVRLHSCAAYPTVRSHIFNPSYDASKRCLSTVDSLREIAKDVLNTGMLNLLGPPFTFALYVACRLLLVHSASTGVEPDPNCEVFIYILGLIGRYWGHARHYAQLLDQMWKRARLNWTDLTGSVSSASKALAMMRRTAYEIHATSVQRQSMATGTLPKRSVTPEELEYFEVFSFFNYPRLPAAMMSNPNLYASLLNIDGTTPAKEGFMSSNFPS